MKKRILMLLMSVMLVAGLLAGCGGGSSSGGDEDETEAPETTAGSETTEASGSGSDSDFEYAGALEGVTLTVGTSGTYAPFSYFDADGTTLVGYDVDLLYIFQELLGFEIADGTIQDMDYSPLTTSIGQGMLDIAMAALCATDERSEIMNFSNTYYDAGIVVVVSPDNEEITDVSQLEGGEYTVAVQSGTIAYTYATTYLPEDCLQVYDSQALAYKAVEDGQADATIYDYPGTAYSISTGEINLKIVGDEFYNGQAPYCVAFSFDICEEYPEIVDYFNAAIDYLNEQGTIDALTEEWFG